MWIEMMRGSELVANAARGAAMDPSALIGVLIGAGAVVFGLVLVVALIKRFLFICGPHEIVVFSGRAHRLPDGSTSNYKILHGGRGFRLPFLEVVRKMDMRLFPVDVTVQNAYSSGGIPLTVRAIANVKLSNDDVAVRYHYDPRGRLIGEACRLLGEDASFVYERDAPLRPWTITSADGILDLTFEPGGMHSERTALGLVSSTFLQPVGRYRGLVRLPGRPPLELSGVPGVSEHQDVRW